MKTGKKIWLCIAGILLIALGVYFIIRPDITLVSAAYVLGILTLFTGIFKLIFTFRTQAFMPNSGTRMLSALLDILFGCFFLFNLLGTAASLPFVFAIWVIIEGISVIVASFDYKKVGFTYWWALLLLGIVGVVLGILGLKNMGITAATLSTLISIAVILFGVSHILAVAGVNRFEKVVDEQVKAIKDQFTPQTPQE
jgi:uncharacterized membrane protein HdeD (DUF308 family)